jgi:hypothetical protein
MQHGAEQRRLVIEARVERPLGDACRAGDLLDARGAVAFGKEELRGGIEDPIGKASGLFARRAAAAGRRSSGPLLAQDQRPFGPSKSRGSAGY